MKTLYLAALMTFFITAQSQQKKIVFPTGEKKNPTQKAQGGVHFTLLDIIALKNDAPEEFVSSLKKRGFKYIENRNDTLVMAYKYLAADEWEYKSSPRANTWAYKFLESSDVIIQFSDESSLNAIKKELTPYKISTDFRSYGYAIFYTYKKYGIQLTFNDADGAYSLGIWKNDF